MESMEKKRYIVDGALSAEEIKAIRKKLNLTQSLFAELVHVSKKTIERWETSTEEINGPIVPLIRMLWAYPEYVEKLQIPEKIYPLRIWYMYQNSVCTLIDVDERNRKLRIRNYTDQLMKRAFGAIVEPSYEQYEAFMESRCFPPTRDKMKIQLAQIGVPFYDPLLIIEKTQGRMAEDLFWLKIER